MKCATCGKKITDDIGICKSCGSSTSLSNSKQKPKKKKNKTLIAVIVSIVLVVFAIIAGIFIVAAIDVIKEDKAAMSIADSAFGLEYYEKIKEDISEESYDMLVEIKNKYDIDVKFAETITISGTEKYFALPKEKYDFVTKRVYDILQYFGDETYTVSLIGSLVNSIYCYDTITFEGEENSSVTSPLPKKISLAVFEEYYYEKNYLMLDFASPLAWLISDQYDLFDTEFATSSSNGFIGYDNRVIDDEKYSNILRNNSVFGNNEQEMLEAGFLYSSGIEEIANDFNHYVCGLFGNEDDFWEKYAEYEAVNKKTKAVVKFLNILNPKKWNFDYFVELSHPSGLSALSMLESLEYDITADYIGLWEGTYQNNTGKMNVVIDVLEINIEAGEVKASFAFSPGIGNTRGLSGEYSMVGDIDLLSGDILLRADEWISDQPPGYEMLDIIGIISFERFDGLLMRGEMREIYLTRKKDDDLIAS